MFITFEGGEGTGKTTLIEKLKNRLIKDGYDVVVTREPGGSKIAEKIRGILLDPDNQEITYATEALLFAASRAQHIDEVIVPALNKNQLILCDRYLDSSIAYQAHGRNLGESFIKQINAYALKYMPDLTIYIDLDPQIGQKRVHHNRGHKVDRLDQAAASFHEKVRQGYLTGVLKDGKRVKKIEGNQSIDHIFKEVYQLIKERL